MSQFTQSMAVICKGILGSAIRAEGLLALKKEVCKACSSLPDYYPEIKGELDHIVVKVEQLVEIFDKEKER